MYFIIKEIEIFLGLTINRKEYRDKILKSLQNAIFINN